MFIMHAYIFRYTTEKVMCISCILLLVGLVR